MSGSLISGILFLSSTFMLQICTSTAAPHPACPLVITPSRLVVKYGDSAFVSCRPTVNPSATEPSGWEASTGTQRRSDNSSLTWILEVPNVTDWLMKPKCYINWDDMTKDNESDQCFSTLDLTVYQPPERVYLSVENISLGHQGEEQQGEEHQGEVHLVEGRQYRLLCTVQNVAPIQNLRVLFKRGSADALGTLMEEPGITPWPLKPQNRSYTWDYTARAEDDGGWVGCEASLELGPAGPQTTPVMTSDPVNTTVHFRPKIQNSSSDQPISITEGDTLELSCTVRANPAPTYSWTLPQGPGHAHNESALVISHVSSVHTGVYTCVVNNTLGSASLTYRVEVKVDWLPIIAGLVGAGILVAVAIGVIVYRLHHSQTRTGRYDLRNIFQSLRCASDHVALPNGSPW